VSAIYGNFYVDGSYSYGHTNWGTINRNTGAYGLTATGTTTGRSHTVQLNTGYNVVDGQMVLGPLASLYYTRAEIDSYTETNAIHLNAVMPSQNLDSLVATLGGQASYTFRDGPIQITPQLRLGVDIGMLDNDRNLTFSLANRPNNPAATFTGLARTVGDTAFHGGAGVMFRYQNAALVLDYDVRANNHRTDHLFGTSLRVSF
jgi:outer membrane autotransporter protein